MMCSRTEGPENPGMSGHETMMVVVMVVCMVGGAARGLLPEVVCRSVSPGPGLGLVTHASSQSLPIRG